MNTCARQQGVTVDFTGDVLLDRGVRTQIQLHSLESLCADLPVLFGKADYVIGNLECPVIDTSSPITKKFTFRGDVACLPILKKAGYTHFNLANNHSYDQGRDALTATAGNIKASGLVPVGFGSNAVQACEPAIIHQGYTRIAIFSSVLLRLENWMYLPDKPCMCQATVEELCTRIKAYKARHTGDIIAVYLHWGVEMEEKPTTWQHVEAHKLIDAGADIIIGHHPHVVQSIEVYKGCPIFYSLGNFIFDQQKEICSKTFVLQLKAQGDKLISTAIRPAAIVNCKPVPMSSTEQQKFIAHIQTLSPRVQFTPSEGEWLIMSN